MSRKLWLAALAASLLIGAFQSAAAAAPVEQYVLKHPGREGCKANYVRRSVKTKTRRHGKTVKVSRPGCVYVAPRDVAPPGPGDPPSAMGPSAPGTPAPGPAPVPTPTPTPTPTPDPTPIPPAGPASTSTSVKVDPVGNCGRQELPVTGHLLVVEECVYNLSAAVKTADGAPVPSAHTAFVLKNAGSPTESWTIEAGTATIATTRTWYAGLETTELTDSVEGQVAKVNGTAPWEVTAVFSGLPEFAASQSTVQTAP